MKAGKSLLIVPVLLILATVLASGQSVPQLINYQGRLTNASGQPLDGVSVDLTFRFYSAETAGALYLTVSQPGVQASKGIYNVLIGSGAITPGTESILAGVFQKHGEVWMSVQVGTDPEMIPRSLITSVPYAFRAQSIDASAIYAALDADPDHDSDGIKNSLIGGSDCNDNDPNNWTSCATCVDNDLDLWFAGCDAYFTLSGPDCADWNPDIYPGAPEICDRYNNQCPGDPGYGLIDEGCLITLIGSYDTPGNAVDVYVSGNWAYVAGSEDGGLQIIDVSNPSAPAFVGSYDTPGGAYHVSVQGNYAYVADGGFLRIINISNPAMPTLTSSWDAPDMSYDVYANASYAYCADRYSGLEIINVSNPNAPFRTGSYDTPDYAFGVFVSGSFAYIGDYYSLQIINITNPANPVLAGSYPNPTGEAEAVFVNGNYAYIADHFLGLQILDVSDPAFPILVGSYQDPFVTCPLDVFVNGNYAYVAGGCGGGALVIVNISNPAFPTFAASFSSVDAYYESIFVVGNYAYVTDGCNGLKILNIAGLP